MKFFKSILAVAILASGLFFTGCDNAEEAREREQAEKYEKYGVLYYVDAEIIDTEVFDETSNVYCVDVFGEHYAFFGEGFEVGDKVQLEIGDNDTENDNTDDIIVDVLVY
jgi:hypothetical protein